MCKLSIILVCVLVAGCGGGGGGGGGASPPPGITALGSRELQGYAVTVTASETVRPGATLQIQAKIAESPGQPPLQVEMALSDNGPDVWLAGTAVDGGTGTWAWTVTVPQAMDGQRVWVRLVDPQLNSAESGGQDFALVP